MKIADPVKNETVINGHFGKSEKFKIYSINNGAIESVEIIPSYQGGGCRSGIATQFAGDGVKVVLTSGIGEGALKKLRNAGLEVIRGCNGTPNEMVELYLNGKLTDAGSTCHKHNHKEHSHHDHHIVSDKNTTKGAPGTDLRIKN